VSDAELDRIRTAYSERDARGRNRYSWSNPAYVAYMQNVERALLRAFAATGVQLSGARVLDVGCGSGYFLHRLQEYGAGSCHGVDLMENRIQEGRERYPTLQFQVATATQLPFEDGAFDLVTQFTCLSSILDEGVRLAAATEMRRVAGRWLLSLDLRGIRPRWLRRPGRPDSTPIVPLDSHELRRLFGEPAVLQRVALAFDVVQVVGRYALLDAALAGLPPLRSHLLGIWRVAG